ncbi:MAG: hypothetical protein QG575_819 [Euryarchaeota archaeon]|nr:hypothetical protein [Euryarchaeota archaeon]
MKNSAKAGMVMVLAILLPLSLNIALAGNVRSELPNAVMQESGLASSTTRTAIHQNCSNLRDCIENCSRIQNCFAYLTCIENCTSNATVGFEGARSVAPIDLLQTNESTTSANRVLFQLDEIGPDGEMGGVPGLVGGADRAASRQGNKSSSGDIKIKEDYQVVKES